MTDVQRAILQSLYAAVISALPVVSSCGDVHRALCQLRASLERTLELERTPRSVVRHD